MVFLKLSFGLIVSVYCAIGFAKGTRRPPLYNNEFAVHIPEGPEAANEVATNSRDADKFLNLNRSLCPPIVRSLFYTVAAVPAALVFLYASIALATNIENRTNTEQDTHKSVVENFIPGKQ
ncbi:hypothetical protein Trydic_g21708 [Trypoxylus dichotomus]